MVHHDRSRWGNEVHRAFDARVDSAKQRAKQVIDFATPGPAGEPSRLQQLFGRSEASIKAHPYAALGIAFALGYVVTRLARR